MCVLRNYFRNSACLTMHRRENQQSDFMACGLKCRLQSSPVVGLLTLSVYCYATACHLKNCKDDQNHVGETTAAKQERRQLCKVLPILFIRGLGGGKNFDFINV